MDDMEGMDGEVYDQMDDYGAESGDMVRFRLFELQTFL